jgi:hypothetical protein
MQQKERPFDHLVRNQQKVARYGQAKSFSCLEVDNELEFGRNLNRQIGGIFAVQNSIDVRCSTPHDIFKIGSV